MEISVVSEETHTILTARIAGAQGLKGDVRLQLIATDDEVAIKSLKSSRGIRAYNKNDGIGRTITLSSLRRLPKLSSGCVASFDEITDRDTAESFYDTDLFVEESARPKLSADEYYVDQLIGLEVKTDSGRSFGKLREVLATPANDVYETDEGVLIPAVPSFILFIDLGERVIMVKDVPGLRD